MDDNLTRIMQANLTRLYARLPENLERLLPAERNGDRYRFRAFGRRCELGPDTVELDGQPVGGPVGILISLYALNTHEGPARLVPLRAFKEFGGSGPYVGAFASHCEQILVPYVAGIQQNKERIVAHFDGTQAPPQTPGDLSFVLYPLPRIPLCYIFYLADEDFPAAVTCLFSPDAPSFLALDALADVGEYTSKAIIEFLS